MDIQRINGTYVEQLVVATRQSRQSSERQLASASQFKEKSSEIKAKLDAVHVKYKSAVERIQGRIDSEEDRYSQCYQEQLSAIEKLEMEASDEVSSAVELSIESRSRAKEECLYHLEQIKKLIILRTDLQLSDQKLLEMAIQWQDQFDKISNTVHEMLEELSNQASESNQSASSFQSSMDAFESCEKRSLS
jgi:hypothetical protein